MTYSATQLQLTSVLQSLYRNLKGSGGLPVSMISKATGGTTTTLIDTALITKLPEGSPEDMIDGTLLLVTDAAGTAVAPEGEYSRITDYDSTASAPTITFSPALTVAPATGDTYIYASPEYPLYDMVQMVNDALFYLGDIKLVDTSLSTLANTTEYTIPVALKRSQIADLWIQGITTNSVKNEYSRIPNWDIQPAAPGTGSTLIVPQFASGYKIMIEYWGRHPKVSAFADPIDERISPDVMKWACLAHAYMWHGGNDPVLQAREQQAWQNLQQSIKEHPINHGVRRVEGFPHWGEASVDLSPQPFVR